jgi:DnaJ-domain-containing protein 1
MPAAAQAALFQTLTAALSKSVGADKRGKREYMSAVNKMENFCALCVRPAQHIREAFQIMMPAMNLHSYKLQVKVHILFTYLD